MKAARFTIGIAVLSVTLCAQSQTANQTPTGGATKQGSAAKTPAVTDEKKPVTSTKGKRYAARCDSQFGDVCVLTLSRLRREDGPHKNASLHRPISVRKGHLVVWIADGEENFQLSKFERVDCKDERKRIDDPSDPGPFDNHYERDSYGKVKYAIVTGPVGNCYKHSIDVDNGKDKKEHIDPHIMIECDTGPC